MIKQRRYIRWILNRNVKFRQGGSDLPYEDCVLTDLSFKGARINTRAQFPKDAFSEISIILDEKFVLNVEAWVVWYKAIGEINSYGVYFSKIKDRDKDNIYKFLCSSYPKQLNQKWWGEPAQQKKEGENMEDRRIFQRFPVKRPLRFLDMGSGDEGHAVTVDVSAKGVGFSSDREIKPSSSLEVWLEVSDQQEPIYARGNVVCGPGKQKPAALIPE